MEWDWDWEAKLRALPRREARSLCQWLWSNLLIIFALYVIYRLRECIPNTAGAFLILAVAFAATVLDYVMNRDFYFPTQDPVGP